MEYASKGDFAKVSVPNLDSPITQTKIKTILRTITLGNIQHAHQCTQIPSRNGNHPSRPKTIKYLSYRTRKSQSR